MPHGGTAAKLGDRYEGRIAIWRLLQLIDDTHDSVKFRIEQPGLDEVEWWVEHANGSRTYTQVKRQHSSPTAWTIGDLKKVITGFRSILEQDASARCVFHSTLSASHLQEFHECSWRTLDLAEFKQELAGQEWKDSWRTLLRQWAGLTEDEARLLVRRVIPDPISERLLQDALHGHARGLVKEDPAAVISRLGTFLDDRVGRELTAPDVWHFLTREAKMYPTDWNKDQNLHLIVDQATRRFQARNADDRAPLAEITRSETKEVATALLASGGPSSVTFVAGAGVGKSGTLSQVIDAITASSSAKPGDVGLSGPLVLAARLDALDPFNDAPGLGRAIGLPDSPGIVLSRLAAGRPALLVLDQVDAFGASSGRKPLRLSAVAEAVRDAHALGVRVLLACREFDVELDFRLAELIGAGQPSGASSYPAEVVKLAQLRAEDVDEALRRRGVEPSDLDLRLRELLRVPLHLRLFATLHARGTLDLSALDTRSKLFEQFLRHVRDEVQVVQPAANVDAANDALAEVLSDRQELYTPVIPVGVDSVVIERMTSAGWLRQDNGKISFAHEAFFDYAYAVRHLRSGTRLIEVLTSGPQHLFRRAQVRQILTLERDRDRPLYLREVREVLSDPTVRAHIKELVIRLATSVPDPTAEEWTALGVLGQVGTDSLAERACQLAARQERFGGFLLDRGIIAAYLMDPAKAPIAAWMCISLVQHHPQRVIDLLEPHAGDPTLRAQLDSVITAGQGTRHPRVYDLLVAMIDAGDYDRSVLADGVQHNIFMRLTQVPVSITASGARVVGAWIRRRAKLLADNGAFTSTPTLSAEDDEQQNADLRVAIARAAARLEKQSKTALLGDSGVAPQVLASFAQQDAAGFVGHVLPAVRYAVEESRTGELRFDGEQCLVLRWPLMEMAHNATAVLFRRLAQALSAAVSEGDAGAISAVREMSRSPLAADQALAAAGFEARHPDLLADAAQWLAHEPYALGQDASAAVLAWVCEELAVDETSAIQQRAAEYIPDFEADDPDGRGRHAQRLLTQIPENRLTTTGQDRKTVLDSKFPPPPPPRPPTAGLDLSIGLSGPTLSHPIDPADLSSMDTSQLVAEILAHPDDEPLLLLDSMAGKVTAHALARQLAAQVPADIERFIVLLDALPAESSAIYSDSILEALGRCAADTPQLIRAALAVSTHAYVCRHQISLLIQRLVNQDDITDHLTDAVLDDLIALALMMLPPDPQTDPSTETAHTAAAQRIGASEGVGDVVEAPTAGDTDSAGTAQRLASAVESAPERPSLRVLEILAQASPRVQAALDGQLKRLAIRPDLAARAMVIDIIARSALDEVDATMETALTALDIGPDGQHLNHLTPLVRAELAAGSSVRLLLLRLCWARYDLVAPVLRAMLDPYLNAPGTMAPAAIEAAHSAAELAVVAACRHPEALALLPQAADRPVELRRGTAAAFSETVPFGEITDALIGELIALLDDPDDEVASTAVMALHRIPDESEELARRVLPAALTARAFTLNPGPAVHLTEQFGHLMPETALDVATRFFDVFASQAGDISTAAAYQATVLGKIVVGVYANNLGNAAIAERALDLIDEGVRAHALGIEEHLDLHGR